MDRPQTGSREKISGFGQGLKESSTLTIMYFHGGGFRLVLKPPLHWHTDERKDLDY
jgi:hypothetical protein